MMEKLIWPALNLMGLLGFLAYKTKSPLMSFVKGRRTEIFDGLNKSRQQLEAAENRRKEIEAKLRTLDVEKSKIITEWKEKTAHQSQAIREGSERVIRQMKAEAEQNKRVLVEVTRKTIEQGFRKAITAQAEQKIIQSLNPEVHKRLNSRLLGDVSKGGQV